MSKKIVSITKLRKMVSVTKLLTDYTIGICNALGQCSFISITQHELNELAETLDQYRENKETNEEKK